MWVFPSFFQIEAMVLAFSETCLFIDIILNFLKQKYDDDGIFSRMDPLHEVAQAYLNSYAFKLDFLSFLPWGWMFGFIDERLKFMWVIKVIRIVKLNSYISDRQLMPIVKTHIENKQKKFLKDPIQMYCVDEDHVFITERFYIANFIKISRLILKTLFITFVLGIVWYIFSATTHMFKFGEDSEQFELDGDEDN